MGRQSTQDFSKTQKKEIKKKNKANHKKPWSEKQDKLLEKLIAKFGPSRWSAIARSVPGRQGKQCRERWHNHLNPEIKKTDWETPEQWILFLAYTLYQSKWAYMTQLIPGRTDNSIKNHWNSGMKKRLFQFEQLLEKLLKQRRSSYLSQFCQNKDYLTIQAELISKIFQVEHLPKIASESIILKENSNQEKHQIQNIFRPDDISVLGQSNRLFKEENASNMKDNYIKDSEMKDGQMDQLPKIMRLNSIFSDRKDKMNYPMIFETPPRKKFQQDPFGSAAQSSQLPLLVQEIYLQAADPTMESPSKFIMM